MIDEKFSQEAFESLGLDTPEANKLAQELAKEVQNEIHEVLYPAFQQIIEKLNKMGHNLKLYEDVIPGDIAYRDDSNDNGHYKCKLRVALDTVVSTGYPDVWDESE